MIAVGYLFELNKGLQKGISKDLASHFGGSSKDYMKSFKAGDAKRAAHKAAGATLKAKTLEMQKQQKLAKEPSTIKKVKFDRPDDRSGKGKGILSNFKKIFKRPEPAYA